MFITHAAIMFSNGEIVEGTEYHAVRTLVHKIGLSGEHINGFVTSYGDFVLPEDAAMVALKSGQIKIPVSELSSDDLWPSLITD